MVGRCRDRIEATLTAVEDVQRSHNAFIAIRADAALDEADALDRRGSDEPRGALDGLPVVVKDLFDVAGLPTTGGCGAYLGRVADHDAAVVAALRRAGAIIVAKTNQHELGAGATGLVSAFGPVTNPIDPQRLAGGSSSGSAVAVATGAVPLAIGTDTGGSIRIPASFCGITGLRPTPGRISLAGAMPMSPGYDTAGPMAATARECAAAFAVLARGDGGHVPRDLETEGLRVGLPQAYFESVHADTLRAVEAAAREFEALGAAVVPIGVPPIDADFEGFPHVWADLAYAHPATWDHPAVSADVAALVDQGRRLTGLEYAASRAAAERMREQFADAFQQVDVLLAPATPFPAPRADAEEVAVEGGVLDVHRGAPSRLTVPVNEAGVPAVAFPVGTTADGLPIGAQLIGRPYRDEQLLAVVAACQDAAGGT
jgi:aspartyl-tRNA(Asn)/glutamyl-tRNA(Gln) amidotransferase subunit A